MEPTLSLANRLLDWPLNFHVNDLHNAGKDSES